VIVPRRPRYSGYANRPVCLSLHTGFETAPFRQAQLHQAQGHYPQALVYAQVALIKARQHPDKFDPELVSDLEEQVAFIQSKIMP